MSTELILILIFIFIYILMCSIGSVPSFSCFDCSFHPFGYNDFYFLVVMIPPRVSVYNRLWLYFKHHFLLVIYILIVFPLLVLAVHFHVTVRLYMALLVAYFLILLLPLILHRHFWMPHHGCILSLIISCLVCLLLITYHHHKLRHHLPFLFTNLYYNEIHLWIYRLTPQ